jgi:ribosomal protein S18 acetylase RimI-like enzyme
MFESAGYRRVRWFFEMERPDLEDVSVPPLPEGLEIRPCGPGREEVRRVFDAATEAFRDHWGGFSEDEAALDEWMGDPDFDPSLFVVAWDGDEVAGAVTNGIYAADNEAYGRRRGWLDMVFVRRPWRRRGLAAALVARSLVLLRERGMTSAVLGVDSENPSGALGLYEAAGFRVTHRAMAYRKPMEEAHASDAS